MKITINGNDHILVASQSIAALLEELNLNPRKFAIEQNLAIIPANEYQTTYLEDGDIVEIVEFIGGG